MPSVNIGIVSPVIKGAWDETADYDRLNIVHGEDGATYQAVQAVPAGTALSNTTYWMQLTPKAPTFTAEDVAFDAGGTVENTGTDMEPKLHFSIPRGVTGNESLDNTAGLGDTDVVVSADRVANAVKNEKSIIANLANTNLIANAVFEKGGWGAISNWSSPNLNTYVYRAHTTITFEEPKDIIIVSDPTVYQYGLGAFDVDNNVIAYSASWENDPKVLSGVKTLRLHCKNRNDSSSNHIRVWWETENNDFGLKVYTLDNPADFSDLIAQGRQSAYMTWMGKWVNGSWSSMDNYENPTPTESTRRIRNEIIFDKETDIEIRLANPGYQITCMAFDENNILCFRSSPAYSDESRLITGAKTLRMIMKNSEDSGSHNVDITFADLAKSGLSIVPHVTNKQDAIRLKVMDYNIGRFSYGVSPKYLSQNHDEKLANYKKFFFTEACDILGMQECNQYLDASDSTGTESANDIIFYPLYPYSRDNYGNTCIKSKYKLYNAQTLTFECSDRKMAAGYIHVGDKQIFVVSTHLTPNAGQEEMRAEEMAELITILSKYKYFICFGDFNTLTGEESLYELLKVAGFHVADGGYLPYEWTYSMNRDDYSRDVPVDPDRKYLLDNIVTSSNIIIENFKIRKDMYTLLSSDHIPVTAELVVL